MFKSKGGYLGKGSLEGGIQEKHQVDSNDDW